MFRVAPSQHGIIVAHYMGTGKTITALTFLQNCDPVYDVIIVHPPVIRHVWREDARKLGLATKSESYTYKTYNEFFALVNTGFQLQNRIIVFDEAHHLAQTLQALHIEQAVKLYNQINAAKRVLLLTGTPIYDSEYDFRWLINIAAGQPVLPISDMEFRQKFFRKRLVAGLLHTWAMPIIKWGVTIVSTAEVAEWTTQMRGHLENFFEKLDLDGFKSKVATFKVWRWMSAPDHIKTATDAFGQAKAKFNAPAGPISIAMHSFYTAILQLFGIKLEGYAHHATMQTLTVFTPLIIFLLLTLLQKILAAFRPDDFAKLDASRVIETCGRFISVYETPTGSSSNLKAHFPAVHYNEMPVSYTGPQLWLWMRLTWPGVSTEDLMNLVPKSLREMPNASNFAKLVAGRFAATPDDWRNYGRVIGNLSVSNQIPSKFYRILKMMKRVDNKRVVIYSNFWEEGGMLMSDILIGANLKHGLYHPSAPQHVLQNILEAFEKGDIPIIIIHPSLTEGYTIRGARQLHIMEPMLSYAKQQQLVSRVVRFQSHSSLPLNERKLNVYMWYMSVSNIIDTFRRHTIGIRQWFTSEIHVNYLQRTMHFAQDVSPDYLALSHTRKLQAVVDSLKNVKHGRTMNSLVPSAQDSKDMKHCCLWEPNPERMWSCLVNRSGQRC